MQETTAGKVLITGATGFVGWHVTRLLLERGYVVHAAARETAKVRNLYGAAVTAQQVDFSSAASISEVVNRVGPDYVIHLIGIIAEQPAKGVTFEAVHHAIPRDIYQALKGSGVRRVVHMSALGVHPDAPSLYHKSKASGEAELMAAGIPHTIMRPSVVIGPEQKLFRDMKKVTDLLPVVLLPNGGRHRMQPVDVRDVAMAFVNALDRPEAEGRIYELCGPDALTFREMLEALFTIWQRKVLFVSVPVTLLSGIASIGERLLSASPITTDMLLMMWRDNVCGIYGGAVADGVRELVGRDPIPFQPSLAWALGR